MTDRPEYPHAERLDIVEDLHGHPVADPYRWLEDADDPRTKAWSEAQDALLARHRGAWPARTALRDRLAELLAVGMVGVPIWRGDRPFYLRRTAEQEHAVLLTRDPDGNERTLVDPTALDPSGATTLDFWYPSPDGAFVAYGRSSGGTEMSDLYVLDVATAEDVEGPIDRARHSSVGWLADASGFYYTRHLPTDTDPEAFLDRRVYLHRRDSDPDTDALVFGEGGSRGRYYQTRVSADGRWLVVDSSQGTDPRTNVYLADLSASPPEAPEFRTVQEDVDNLTYLSVHNGRCYLWTDRDAPRRRIAVTSPDRLEYADWQDLVVEDSEAVLEDFVILDDLDRPVVLVRRTRHAISELTVHDLATGARIADVPLPGVGSIDALVAPRHGAREAWFTYTDFTTPGVVYRYDGTTGEVTEWARPPGTVDLPALTTRQIVYTSVDGTEVRMFVVGSAAGGDGPRPTILYGYGGFNISLTPGYVPRAVAWVESGGVYAIANLRGGSEEGERWHRAGMLADKQNVFDDFGAAADHLVHSGITTPDRLAVFGGSNGGLLVGAAVTQFPEKFAAAVCSAPLLDMVRYELFGLGSTWAGEYGTAQKSDEFGWLFAYSPYHRTREGVAYPAVLFSVFEGDTRVDPLHARKLAAALQHATSGAAPILVRRETEVGHSARSVSRSVELLADELAFLAAHTGLRAAP